MINFPFKHTLEKNWKNYQETEKENVFALYKKFASILTMITYYQSSRCFIRFVVISR